MILLDTHALIWVDQDAGRLGRKTRSLLDRSWSKGELAVSAVSFFEARLLWERQRVRLSLPPARWRDDFLEQGLLEWPVDGAIALRAAGLSGLSGDPVDRLIVATALERRATLITADRSLLGWDGPLSRQDASG